jgi:hypothetical protein
MQTQATNQTQGTPTAIIPTSGAPVEIPLAPHTVREYLGLRARQSELSSQINAAVSRRDRLARQIERTDATVDRTGLSQRLQLLDNRIIQLETDQAAIGRQLTTPQAGELSSLSQQTDFGGLSRGNVTAISIIFTIFVLAPLALAAARNMWKRGNRPVILPDAENARRIEQIQQSVDAIAVEMERVSEGQRFVTKILAEQQRVPAIAPAPETILQQSSR